jgi:hypothetical protein
MLAEENVACTSYMNWGHIRCWQSNSSSSLDMMIGDLIHSCGDGMLSHPFSKITNR